MPSWLEDIAGPNFAPAVLWTLLALVVLVIVLVIVRIVRSMTFGTFVAGGRNRKTRLAVMDAAAVDSQRRLVLVRRDDVEHLILIGGPTDVVVERDIRLHAPTRRPRAPADRRRAPAPAEPAASRVPSNAGRLRACRTSRATPGRPARTAARKVASRHRPTPRRPACRRLPPAPQPNFSTPRPAPAPPRRRNVCAEAPRRAAGFRPSTCRRRARQEEAGNDAGRRDEPPARRAFEQAVGSADGGMIHNASSGGPT